MNKNIIYILIGIVVVVLIYLFVFRYPDFIASLVASFAGIWATFKSKFFDLRPLKERIQSIKDEHAKKREEWEHIREEYDSQYRALKARMDYLDHKSLLVYEKMNLLDKNEQAELSRLSNRSFADRLKELQEIENSLK